MTVLEDRSRSADAEAPRWWARVVHRLQSGVGGAALLLLATLAALLWANSPWGDTYDSFWHTGFSFALGDTELTLDLQHWVNDGLMTFFFFVVGLEVKRELVIGELADRRRAAVPMVAALAGLVVPALVYVVFNLGGSSVGAWGVVISTDTAFLLGLLALLGSAVPPALRVFLMALAIADDVGALLVIAVFYTEDLRLGPLALALLGLAVMFGLRFLNVWRGPGYLVIAVAAWIALYLSGVHATLLGVAIALMTPAYRPRRTEVEDASRRTRAYLQSPNPGYARAAQLSISRSVPVGERLQQLWGPWTTYVIVPLFALANAGVVLDGATLRAAATSTITIGVVAGLVAGKLIGILAGAGVAVKLGLGDLAQGLTRGNLAGGAALSGIGFTISLFIVDLAFDDEQAADQARVGILVASVVAAVLGSVLLRLAARRRPVQDTAADELRRPVDPDRDHVQGPDDAPLTLVEYADFECPFCGRATGSVDALRRKFGDQLRYVFRHAPHTAEHRHARLAAEAAEAAGAQGRFWEMHARLYAQQDGLTSTDLVDHAAALDLDLARFTRDLGSGRFARRVQEDLRDAEASGVQSLPTFFVNGRRHTGQHDAETLGAALTAGRGDPRTTTGPAVPAPGSAAHPEPELPDLPADLPETPEQGGDHPRLTDAQIDRLAAAGSRVRVERGDRLYRPGDLGYDFHAVVSGAVAVVGWPGGSDSGEQATVRVHGARRFLGELDLFTPVPVVRTAVVIEAGEVVRLTVDQLRSVLDDDTELRDLVQRAFLVRRAIRLQMTVDLQVIGRSGDPATQAVRRWARSRNLTAVFLDVDGDQEESSLLDQFGIAEEDLPVVVPTGSGRQTLRHPDEATLDGVFG